MLKKLLGKRKETRDQLTKSYAVTGSRARTKVSCVSAPLRNCNKLPNFMTKPIRDVFPRLLSWCRFLPRLRLGMEMLWKTERGPYDRGITAEKSPCDVPDIQQPSLTIHLRFI